MRAADDLHPGLRLVHDEVELLLRAGNVRDEIHDIRIEAQENEPAVIRDARRRLEPQLLFLECRSVSARIENADQIAVIVECPGMIEALEGFRVAFGLAADLRAPMRAAIDQHAHLAVAVANQDDRASAHVAALKIAGIADLGLVADIDPGTIEDAFAFEFENFWRGVGRAMNLEETALGIIDHQVADTAVLHDHSSIPDERVGGRLRPYLLNQRQHRKLP